MKMLSNLTLTLFDCHYFALFAFRNIYANGVAIV